MLRNQLLAVFGVHDIESEGHTFLAVLLDSLLDSLGTTCQKGYKKCKQDSLGDSEHG